MIRGGIWYEGKTELKIGRGRLNAARDCVDIILPAVVPYIHNGNPDFFQQDNARCHTALYTRNILAAKNINTLEWPSRLPDLSPIEHMWDHLGRRLRERNDVNNVNDLERALHEE